MFEGTAVTIRGIHPSSGVSMSWGHLEQLFPIYLKAQVSFRWRPFISALVEESELGEWVSQLASIVARRTSKVDPFEVFDLRPLRSHRVIVEVRERRPASFQFAAEDGKEEVE